MQTEPQTEPTPQPEEEPTPQPAPGQEPLPGQEPTPGEPAPGEYPPESPEEELQAMGGEGDPGQDTQEHDTLKDE